MNDGYENSEENDFSDLDEWLCEYVDGTIDPIVREALEEYMEVNPALASHVENLCKTRHLLCRFGCRHEAPRELQPRLRNRLASEIVNESEPVFSKYTLPLATIAALSSFAAIVLIIASTTTSSAPPSTSSSAASATYFSGQPSLQLPVLQATPSERLNKYPIYSRFTNNGSAILPYKEEGRPQLTPLITNQNQTQDTITSLNHLSSRLPAP